MERTNRSIIVTYNASSGVQMNKLLVEVIVLLLLASACSTKNGETDCEQIISMQIMDRNGFAETISNKERLARYNHTDFLSAQPYEKVLRIFSRNKEGKTTSCITTYHPNGYPWQYLEIIDGRAHGQYLEWHANGKKRLDAVAIDGVGDVDMMSQKTWLFENLSRVWNEEGVLIAEIYYEAGLLQGVSKYYYPTGKLWKEVPYHDNRIQGTVQIYNADAEVVEVLAYEKGELHGLAKGPHFEENYEKGKLLSGIYTDNKGDPIARIQNGKGKRIVFSNEKIDSTIEYCDGSPNGQIQVFDEQSLLHSTFVLKNGKKNGEEIEYFPGGKQPKLALHWHEDIIQGVEKSWYENGVMESQREMNANKKHGLSFAWYSDGQLMLMEEYDQDNLIKASYYKRGDKNPVSTIENGAGTAILFDSTGILLKKIHYEKGKPTLH